MIKVFGFYLCFAPVIMVQCLRGDLQTAQRLGYGRRWRFRYALAFIRANWDQFIYPPVWFERAY